MKTKIRIVVLVLAFSLVVTSVALADGGISLPRWVFSGGASDSTVGGTTLRATLGQPVVGIVTGGDVTLGQGFWYDAAPGYGIYLPLVIRD